MCGLKGDGTALRARCRTGLELRLLASEENHQRRGAPPTGLLLGKASARPPARTVVWAREPETIASHERPVSDPCARRGRATR
jgi:hypothetical protein